MEELLALEAAGWASLCDGTGSEFYGSVMTDDGVMVLAHGEVLDRDEVIAALREAPRWSSYSIENARVVELVPGASALVYRGTGRRDDGSEFVGLMTSVYVRTGESWRLAVYQQTAVPDEGSSTPAT